MERMPLSHPRWYVCVEWGGGQSWCMASTPQCTWSLAALALALASQWHVQLLWAFVDSLRS